MRIECELLGTGTSYGVPTIGCDCAICASTNPKNKRLRSSIVLRVTPSGGETKTILVDVTPDLRAQALRAELKRVDAVLLTHSHADHCHGLDDMRAFYWRNGRQAIPLYGYAECLNAVQHRFDYIFDDDYNYRGIVRFDSKVIDHAPFNAAGIEIEPIPLVHGPMRVAAFRIGEFAYITDTNHVPPSSIEKLRGVKYLVIDALRRKPHPTHLSLPEALEICETLEVERAFFTHINHDMEHEEVSRELPDFAQLGYDTFQFAVEDGTFEELGDRLS